MVAIHNLPSGDVKKLQGQNGYRLRVDDYRVIFDMDGNILYIERIGNRGLIYIMTSVKERIIGAVTIMNDSDVEKFWNILLKNFVPSWDNIDEVEPDEYDLQMLKAIESDPECHQFTPESEIDWEHI